MSASSQALTYAAPAKVNLRLEVLGRRSDGYHELFTTFLALDWWDRLVLSASEQPGIALELGGPALADDVPADQRNLAWRAADAFFERSGVLGGVHLRLDKYLPSQAGLGGGSADAAAVFLGLCELFDQRQLEALEPLAALGSDTVFFAAARRSGYAHARGRGERIEPLPLPAAAAQRWIAVITPRAQASTAAVYARLGLPAGGLLDCPEAPIDWLALPLRELRAQLFNGLERAAVEALPGVARTRELLNGIGLEHWRLAGSGASFFGVYAEPGEAEADLAAAQRTALALGEPLRAARLCRPFGSGPRRLIGAEESWSDGATVGGPR